MIQVPESILKRNDQRHEELQKKKDLGPSQADVFRETFKEKQLEIEAVLSTLQQIDDRNKLSELFSQISKDLNSLNKYLATSSLFLIPYDIKICKNALQEMQEKSLELENKLLPKKKFGFSIRSETKKKHPLRKSENNVTHIEPVMEANNFQCGFSDRKGEKLSLINEEVKNKDVVISRLEKCNVVINGSPNTIYLVCIRDCKIVTGPVTTSVFVDNCINSILSFPCQQLRIHNTVSCDFYIHVTTKAIIEDSKCVRFAPYNYVYENIDEHYAESGLMHSRNNWDDVEDFNWLVNNKRSPNWSIIPEIERIQF